MKDENGVPIATAAEIARWDRQVDTAYKTIMALAAFSMSALYYNISSEVTKVSDQQIMTRLEMSNELATIKQRLEDHIQESQRRQDQLQESIKELRAQQQHIKTGP